MHIVIIGPRGVGKSTVGKKLSENLSLPFVDTDEQLKQLYFDKFQEHKEVSEIYQTEGETVFRELEHHILSDCDKSPKSVIATGGGILEKTESYQFIEKLGCVVYLEGNLRTLIKRKNTLPVYVKNREEDFARTLEKRQPLYESLCNLRIKTDQMEVNEVVDHIIQKLGTINGR